MTDSRADAEVIPLWQVFSRSRDPETRSRLIEHYTPFARILAARAYGLRFDRSSSFDDYLQYARVGLIEAIDRYDLARNASFESYSSHRIRGAILNGLENETEAAAQREFWRGRARERLDSVVVDRAPNPERASLEDLIDITIGLALGLVLDLDEGDPVDESPEANPYAATELHQLGARLRALVEQLPEREREVIRGHYFDHVDFQVLAQRYSLTKGRISQIHSQALQRLRRLLADRPKLDRRL